MNRSQTWCPGSPVRHLPLCSPAGAEAQTPQPGRVAPCSCPANGLHLHKRSRTEPDQREKRKKHFSHRLRTFFSSLREESALCVNHSQGTATKHETVLEKKEKYKISPDKGDGAFYLCYPKLRGFNQRSAQPCCTIHCSRLYL